jgi:hypothetical protein
VRALAACALIALAPRLDAQAVVLPSSFTYVDVEVQVGPAGSSCDAAPATPDDVGEPGVRAEPEEQGGAGPLDDVDHGALVDPDLWSDYGAVKKKPKGAIRSVWRSLTDFFIGPVYAGESKIQDCTVSECEADDGYAVRIIPHTAPEAAPAVTLTVRESTSGTSKKRRARTL